MSAAARLSQVPLQRSSSTCSTSKQKLVCKLRQFSPKKKRPPSILVSSFTSKRNPRAMGASPATRVAVELSEFPPTFTKSDIHALFSDYRIENDVAVGNLPRFLYPLRATVFFADVDEAHRAVSALHGRLIGGRNVEVKLVDSRREKMKEMAVKRRSEELKSEIIKKARADNPYLRNAILEIRELEKGNSNYAFLQSRVPLTPDELTGRTQHVLLAHNVVKWELIAGGTAELDVVKLTGDPLYDVGIEALQDLLKVVNQIGKMIEAWQEWEGSWMLDVGMVGGQGHMEGT